jgi:arabinan endo-1,5-alpha-L-arabinosidase
VTQFPRRLCGFAPLLLLLPAIAAAQQGDVVGIHDPSIVAADGQFVLVCTGRATPVYRSSDLFNWRRGESVFAENVPGWAKSEIPTVRSIWAPDISFFGGKYHLYYAVSTFGKNRSCIGHATNVTLDEKNPRFGWTDVGKVIETQPADSWNAIDPAIALDEENRPWLAMGSHWSGIKLRRLDESGALSKEDTKLYDLAARAKGGAIEAPYIVRRNGFYYLFVSFDQCCRGVDSTYNVRVGRSRAITGPYVDREGKAMLEGGATVVLAGYDNVRGPGHCAVLAAGGQDWLVHHFYDANANGAKTLQIRPLRWDESSWPVAGDPLRAPPVASR